MLFYVKDNSKLAGRTSKGVRGEGKRKKAALVEKEK